VTESFIIIVYNWCLEVRWFQLATFEGKRVISKILRAVAAAILASTAISASNQHHHY
jgi:hypothetical protein